MEAIRDGAAAHAHGSRIDRMHNRDRLGAIAFVAGLWVVMLFALFAMWPLIGDGSIKAILLISAALVLAFNTAAIVAMLRHYSADKSFIYGLDILHLDEMRRRKRL